MISGKIILKSGTHLTLNQRFSEIAKRTPTQPRIEQQTNVIIPSSRQELFRNKRPVALSIAQRLKKRSINYRIAANTNRQTAAATSGRARIFQRLTPSSRRRGRVGNHLGANAYLFGGQNGMGIRLRGQGRIGGTRAFRPRTRGYLNNNAISRISNYSSRGNRNNRGRRNGNPSNKNNFNRSNGNRGGKNVNNRGRARNNPNRNVTKEGLDNELEKYMSHAKLENEAVDMNAV
ncbi:unnamed protein product [Adineta ricciae]|uniref:Chromatin target of PRMT1 protein C-terminal domain-containing protein n=1 Tax=Adineta ricciae TaxID=249248 RepID=A0A813VM97_ADIRI|nr:unnamed protein product [Adineta ricciae]